MARARFHRMVVHLLSWSSAGGFGESSRHDAQELPPEKHKPPGRIAALFGSPAALAMRL